MGASPIDCKLVNGLLGDPAVFGFVSKSGEALLFDLGYLDRLSNKDLLRVKTVAVSHTHIDHFIGFDRLLRVNIPHGRMLEVCGPEGIIKNVQGKLLGYSWNLLEPHQVRFVVHELSVSGGVRSKLLENQDGFVPQDYETVQPKISKNDLPFPAAPAAMLTTLGDGTRLEAVIVDHGIPSVAYACQSPVRFHVKEGAMAKLGLTAGPWVRELQIALADREVDQEFVIDGRTYAAGELGAELFHVTSPRQVGYLTDLLFSWDALKRVAQIMGGVETLYCETNYRAEDYAKAYDKAHLTTYQAALVAAFVGAAELRPFHISNIYINEVDQVVLEAENFLKTCRLLDSAELSGAIDAEIQRSTQSHR